jgi:cyclic pyranopterin phosphate synthase
MSPEEIAQVVRIGAKFGVWKIKLTGGEPLLRSDICDVIRAINQISHVRQLSLVTNGVLLAKKAQEISNAGLDFVAVSIPTLDPVKYREITGADCIDHVLDGIQQAHKVGLQVVLNVVVLNEVNVNETLKLIDFAGTIGAIVKFIELLVVPSDEQTLRRYHYDPGLLVQQLGRISVSSTGWSTGGRPKAHPHFRFSNGVEALVVRYPCNTRSCDLCTRFYDGLRLTSDGRLASCMLRDDNCADILSLVRRGASERELEDMFSNAMVEIGKPPFDEVVCTGS